MTTMTTGTTRGVRRPSWLSKIEQRFNRAADALLEHGAALDRKLDQWWTSRARHVRGKSA
jgi:hypothetical protein